MCTLSTIVRKTNILLRNASVGLSRIDCFMFRHLAELLGHTNHRKHYSVLVVLKYLQLIYVESFAVGLGYETIRTHSSSVVSEA